MSSEETEGWIAGCRVNGDRHMAYDMSAGVSRFQKGAAWFHGKPEDPAHGGGDPRLIRSKSALRYDPGDGSRCHGSMPADAARIARWSM